MVTKDYIPDKGDIVKLNFNPTKGHEQRGPRPALVVSPRKYNAMSELSLVCPITSSEKGYPFEVLIKTQKITGVVLSDQIRAISWKERKARYITSASKDSLNEVVRKIKLL